MFQWWSLLCLIQYIQVVFKIDNTGPLLVLHVCKRLRLYSLSRQRLLCCQGSFVIEVCGILPNSVRLLLLYCLTCHSWHVDVGDSVAEEVVEWGCLHCFEAGAKSFLMRNTLRIFSLILANQLFGCSTTLVDSRNNASLDVADHRRRWSNVRLARGRPYKRCVNVFTLVSSLIVWFLTSVIITLGHVGAFVVVFGNGS